jgi:hypothetical protein
MHRALITAIYAYAGLSAAQWGHAMRWLYCPTEVLWCGNVISDPYFLLVNDFEPLAAACAVALIVGCVKERRRPWFTVGAILNFVAASACLVHEGWLLGKYGFPFDHVWWLPWL